MLREMVRKGVGLQGGKTIDYIIAQRYTLTRNYYTPPSALNEQLANVMHVP